MEKKSGAGAAKKIAGSSALLEDKKHKEIVLLLLFFLGKIVSFYGYKNNNFTYIFLHCSFTLLFCGGKNILPNSNNSQELFFWPLVAGARAAQKNTRSQSRSRSQSRLKKRQEPEPLKN